MFCTCFVCVTSATYRHSATRFRSRKQENCPCHTSPIHLLASSIAASSKPSISTTWMHYLICMYGSIHYIGCIQFAPDRAAGSTRRELSCRLRVLWPQIVRFGDWSSMHLSSRTPRDFLSDIQPTARYSAVPVTDRAKPGQLLKTGQSYGRQFHPWTIWKMTTISISNYGAPLGSICHAAGTNRVACDEVHVCSSLHDGCGLPRPDWHTASPTVMGHVVE